eukprot:7380590-Prymnesium_polylepis.1
MVINRFNAITVAEHYGHTIVGGDGQPSSQEAEVLPAIATQVSEIRAAVQQWQPDAGEPTHPYLSKDEIKSATDKKSMHANFDRWYNIYTMAAFLCYHEDHKKAPVEGARRPPHTCSPPLGHRAPAARLHS